MLSHLNSTQKGIILSLAGHSLFAVADAFAKYLSQYYSVLQVVFLQYVAVMVFCVLFSPWLGGFRKTFATPKLHIHIARGVSCMALAVSAVFAFANLPLTTVYTILFLLPFLVTILAVPIFKEKVGRQDWVIIAAGFSGILVALRPGFNNLDPWLMAAFLACLFAAVLSLLCRPLDERETVLSISFYPALATILGLLPFVIGGFKVPIALHMGFFLLEGLVVFVALSLLAYAYRIARFSVVSTFQYCEMIWGIVLGYFIFSDIPDLWMMAGAGIIVASGLYLIYTERVKVNTDIPI